MEVIIAQNFWRRLLGMGNLQNRTAPSAMLFPSLRSVHSFWMRIPLHIVCLNKHFRVIQIVQLNPHSCFFANKNVVHIIEFKEGSSLLRGLKIGDQLTRYESKD